MARTVQEALDETARLAQRIYPPSLEGGGLATALRWAAGSVGVRATLELGTQVDYPLEVAAAIYWSCLEAFEHAGAGTRATVTVREDDGAVAFEIVADGTATDARPQRIVDRIEALGGRLTIESKAGRGLHAVGSLPLSRR